jgi:hypothetical protein
MRSFAAHASVAVALVVAALLAVSGSLTGASPWSPDGLFYQARVYELQGMDQDAALQKAFEGPLAPDLRKEDPDRSGDRGWVSYNAQFYERRQTVPLAAYAIEPLAGDRAVLDVSLAGYVAAVLALFWLLRLRFRLVTSALVTFGTVFLPALTHHSSYPLTDSWGLALMTAALAAAILTLERDRRWIVAWVAAVLLLSFTRDSTWIPILAAAWVALKLRSRVSVWLVGTGVAAALPAVLAFSVPMRELLAQMLNDIQPAPDASWTSILADYPPAIVDFLQADGGFVRDGAWYSAFYLLGGIVLLFALSRGPAGGPAASLIKAAACAAALYVFVVPVFSAFRVELALVPMAAYGLALAVERVAARVQVPSPLRVPAPITHD